jgi:hypothetical protein
MIQPPSVMYQYYMRDAQTFWGKHDDSINVHDFEDNHISICGINADNFFRACRNAMCCNNPLFDELKSKHNREYAVEMIKSLQKAFDIDSSEVTD